MTQIENRTLMCLKRVHDALKENPEKEFLLKDIHIYININGRNWTKIKLYLDILLYMDVIKKIKSTDGVIKYKYKKSLSL